MIIIIILCMTGIFASNPTGRYKVLASDSFVWLGIEIYEIQFFTSTGSFEFENQKKPYGMILTYKKNISSKTLLRATDREWNRLHLVNPEKSEMWINRLTAIWPDIHSGDKIITRVIPGKSTRFYLNGKFSGEINDPDFGYLFCSIWIHPDSLQKTLYQKLKEGDL